MSKKTIVYLVLALLLSGCGSKVEKGTFSFEMNFSYPGAPEFVYDHLTGDISGWWDHSFSGTPALLYIEPKPGGGF